MAFCTECGKSVSDGAKFCANCGVDTNKEFTNHDGQRQQEFVGRVFKCPNCGEVLKSFEIICPACGHEIRAATVIQSVREFAQKIEIIDTEQGKIDLIRTYPIPNVKEDIFEFMILASTNILDEPRKGLFNAWVSKFEQGYQKSKLVFGNSTDFDRIQDIYMQTSKQIKKERVFHSARAAVEVYSKAASFSPNPVFTIVATLIIIGTIISISTGSFGGGIIIVDALILTGAYQITNSKKQNTKGIFTQWVEQEILKIRYPRENEKNAYLLQAKLEQKGFTNIKMINLKDIVIGLLKKSGEIESVTVNGKPPIPNKKLDSNASIIITYHGRPDE